MNALPISFFLDIVIAALLVATIIYGSILNRKLGALRSNKAELDVLIQSFNDACMRAEAGVRNLRSATDEAHRLQQYLSRGQVLRDDISFLIDRGTGLADRLEGNVRSARSEAQGQGMGQGMGQSGSGSGSVSGAGGGAQAAGGDFPRRSSARAAASSSGAGAGSGSVSGAGAAATPPKVEAREITPPLTDERLAVTGEEAAPRGQRSPRERASLRSENRAGGEAVPRSRAEKDLLEALRAKR